MFTLIIIIIITIINTIIIVLLLLSLFVSHINNNGLVQIYVQSEAKLYVLNEGRLSCYLYDTPFNP